MIGAYGVEVLLCSGCDQSPAASVLTVGDIKPTFSSAACAGPSGSS